MPVTSKDITVNLSADLDKGKVVVLNRNTGNIWHVNIQNTVALLNLANNDIFGNEPSQWVNGHILEIIAYGSTQIGAGTLTLSTGANEVTITVATHTATEVNL